MSKKTLVIGASPKPQRYSNKAIKMLRRYGHEVYAFGLREDRVVDVKINTDFPDANEEIHTVAMYIGPNRQSDFYQKIINLRPKRVIFNPGTENHELKRMLKEENISVTEFCVLIMLNQNLY